MERNEEEKIKGGNMLKAILCHREYTECTSELIKNSATAYKAAHNIHKKEFKKYCKENKGTLEHLSEKEQFIRFIRNTVEVEPRELRLILAEIAKINRIKACLIDVELNDACDY
jgi:hypothetical protein